MELKNQILLFIRYELPPLVIDGIPTPVEKMTQAQLRAFIPLMLKYSTGRGKPGWGKDTTKPPWWPEGVPWANVRMDARKTDEKQKVGNLIHKRNRMSKRVPRNKPTYASLSYFYFRYLGPTHYVK